MDLITPQQIRAIRHRRNRAEMLEALQHLDPNGTWTDEASEAEGMDPADLDEASATLYEMEHELRAAMAYGAAMAEEADYAEGGLEPAAALGF